MGKTLGGESELRVERIVMGKGKSVSKDGSEVWLRTFYQVEAVLEQGDDPKEVREKLERMLIQWLSDEEAMLEEKVPKLDLAELDQLPWTTYKTKEPAKEGEAGWIFANTEGAEELVKAMQKREGKLELGAYEYRFSGKEKQFIARKPVKK
jgi:hypothetical protein